MISEYPRVRFAPSPTGYLHIGGLRTALYNYLFAKQSGGKFILRIEDTDRTRYVPGAVENLISTLEWSGLHYDEGPGKEGEFGPYTQSERLHIYKEYTDKLLETGHAYCCFCSKERLDDLREGQKARNEQTVYDKHCLKLTKEEVTAKLASGTPYVVRMNVRHGSKVLVKDIIRGNIDFDTSIIDDQVLIKSDGFPTYHLANVVDDHLMKITHTIRGEEWLPSTPKHVLLYEAFGWEVPIFAHLPLLLNPDRSKLSKRQGDVAVEDYRSKGYLKEALINFISLLGWNAGDDREFYNMDELISSFSIERINKSGAVFNLEKLDWLNAEHLRSKTDLELAELLREELSEKQIPLDEKMDGEYFVKIVSCMKERVKFIKEIPVNAPYFFARPDSYEEKGIQKGWKEDTPGLLKAYMAKINSLEAPSKEDYETGLRSAAEENGVGAGKLIHPVRLVVSGVSSGPGLFEILDALGKEEVLYRIETGIQRLTKV
ncbi:glutamate--tRNA ligase [Ignavibacteriales bacterium]